MDVRDSIKARGFRQGWVAARIGINESHFSEMLSFRKRFPIEKVKPLADIVGVSVDEIIDALTVGKDCASPVSDGGFNAE